VPRRASLLFMQQWADFWNSVANWFGYEEWVWGSAGEWAGAIGTAGALIATVVIIASDKKRAKRQRANSLVSWVAADPWGGTAQATGLMPKVLLENTGEAPILAVHVFHFDGSGSYVQYGVESPGSEHGSLPAGASEEVEILNYGYGKHDRLFLKFIDADNQHWTRDAKSGKYKRWNPSPYSSLFVYAKVKSKQLYSRLRSRMKKN